MAIDAVLNEFNQLSTSAERQAAAAAINRIEPPPADSVANATVWLIIVSAFAAVLVGGVVLIFILVMKDKSAEVLTPIVTAVLGAMAGLVGGNAVKPAKNPPKY